MNNSRTHWANFILPGYSLQKKQGKLAEMRRFKTVKSVRAGKHNIELSANDLVEPTYRVSVDNEIIWEGIGPADAYHWFDQAEGKGVMK